MIDLEQFEGHTSGEWEVVEINLPYQYEARVIPGMGERPKAEGVLVQYAIRTKWEDPQLKGKSPVVGLGWALPEKDGLPERPGIWMSKEDAKLMAAAPELLAECKRLRAREAELVEALMDCLNPVFGDFEAALAKTESEG